MTATPRILLTGAGGKLGGRTLAYLLANGAQNIVAATRDPGTLVAPAGVETRRADFDDPASLETAFAGVDRVLMISTDRVDVPGLRIEQHRAAVSAAQRVGVKHLLYTSMLNPKGSLIPFAPDHLQTEQAIEDSGLDYTILRVSWYAENLLGSLRNVLASGKWFSSAGDGRINYVPREDVARAAAAALVSRSGVKERLDITGRAPLRIGEIAAIAAQISGKPIEVVPVSDEQIAAGARAAGVPEPVIPLIVGTEANIRAGNFDVASDAVEHLTGRKPQSVREYLTANKASWAGT